MSADFGTLNPRPLTPLRFRVYGPENPLYIPHKSRICMCVYIYIEDVSNISPPKTNLISLIFNPYNIATLSACSERAISSF